MVYPLTDPHRLRTTHQIAPADATRGFPRRFGWECACGATGTVRATWGTGEATTALSEAHRRHHEAATSRHLGESA